MTHMQRSDFFYDLPEELIAQTPIEPRDHARLMRLDRATGATAHLHFYDIVDQLEPGDCLIVNDSRVLPSRLYGEKEGYRVYASNGGLDAAVLIGSYKDGRLVGAKKISLSKANPILDSSLDKFGLDISGADEIRAFIFDSHKNIKPLTSLESLKITK